MDPGDDLRLNQRVASGIAHREPPELWARFLGLLASLGEDPPPEHPIRIEPLPGQRSRDVAERNSLVLEGLAGHRRARRDRETSGPSEPLAL